MRTTTGTRWTATVAALAVAVVVLGCVDSGLAVRVEHERELLELDELCPLCKAVVLDVESSLATNATEEAIVKALGKMCGLLPLPSEKKAACEAEFEALAPLLNKSDESVLVKYTPRSICAFARLCAVPCCATPYTPEQIHISLGGSAGEMRVTWVTLMDMPAPMCKWGTVQGEYTQSAAAVSDTFPNGGWVGMIHTCVMTGLAPDARYYYTVGADAHPYWDHPNWALPKDLSFVMPPAPGALPPNATTVFVQVADMGATDASDRTLARISAMALDSALDFVLHAGDIGYADGATDLWGQFKRKISSFAAYLPYQTLRGNHEDYYDGVPFFKLFPVPAPTPGGTRSPDTVYYSFTYGHVRIIALNSEDDFGLAPSLAPGGAQHVWLEAELKAADTPAARALHPWVIVTMHRPMYCPDHSTDCDTFAPLFREAIEDLLATYHVDLHLSGHRHSYSRTTPVLHSKIMPAGAAPTYIVCGVGGSKEGTSGYPASPPPWSVFGANDFGYLHVATTASTLTTKYVDASTGGVLDSLVLTR